jgi:hypothetical protein
VPKASEYLQIFTIITLFNNGTKLFLSCKAMNWCKDNNISFGCLLIDCTHGTNSMNDIFCQFVKAKPGKIGIFLSGSSSLAAQATFSFQYGVSLFKAIHSWTVLPKQTNIIKKLAGVMVKYGDKYTKTTSTVLKTL